MIELEQSINLAKLEQITAERMRKSSRLLRDSKSQQKIQLRKVETGKLSGLGQRGQKQWNWQQKKYTQLLKLIRFTTKQDRQEKQPQVTKSLDHNDDNQQFFSQHFKGSWKPSLQSEILISHCKQPCKSIKYPTQISYQQYRQKSRHEGIYLKKDRSHELNLFKSNLRNSYNRCLNKKSRPSFLKHLLKIEDQPLLADQITPKFNECTKESVTLQPLKRVHERLKSLTPQRTKQEIQKKKSLPLKSINKKSHQRHQSSYLKKVDVSAWTFHNIDQQTI